MSDLLQAYRVTHPDAKRSGREWKGPCPVCGGEDRFWISAVGMGCRGCRPGRDNPAAYKAIAAALGVARPREGRLDPRMLRHNQEKRERLQRERERHASMVQEAQEAWSEARAADGGPGAMYLRMERMCWPPTIVLPPAVRWLPRSHLLQIWSAKTARERPPRTSERREYTPRHPPTYGLAAEAAGVVVYAFTDDEGGVASVDLEALTTHGRRPARRWRRTLGPKGAGLFRVHAAGEELQIVEGAVSALAARWLLDAPAVAAGGTLVSALTCVQAPRARVHVDGDRGGRRWARAAIEALRAPVLVDIEGYARGVDVADCLKHTIQTSAAWREGYEERLGIMVGDGEPTERAKDEARHSAALSAWITD